MNRKKSFLFFIIVIGLFHFSCDQSISENNQEINIGAVLPLSGPLATYGKSAEKGIDLAIEKIKTVEKLRIKVIYENDDGKKQIAISAAEKLITQNKVPLIIGEASSGLSLALSPICNKNKVVLFSPISSAVELTEKGGNYFFRICPSDAFQVPVLANWLLEKKLTRISILFIYDSWGKSLKEKFVLHYLKGGGTVLYIASCMEGEQSFNKYLEIIMESKPQALVVFTDGKDAGVLLKQARKRGINIPIFGADVWGSPELVETAGEAAEGIYFTFPAKPKGEKYEAFVREYNLQYGDDPDIYASYAYDLVHIIGKAIMDGARTGKQFKRYFVGMEPYEGVTGTTQFNKSGDVISKTFDRRIIKDGKSVPAD